MSERGRDFGRSACFRVDSRLTGDAKSSPRPTQKGKMSDLGKERRPRVLQMVGANMSLRASADLGSVVDLAVAPLLESDRAPI